MSDWLTTMNEWLAGLKLLASRGMGDLAEVFHEEGLGSLDILNEALSDPTKAAVLNATARELGIGMARSTVDAYAQWLKDNLESELRESAERVYGYGGETDPYTRTAQAIAEDSRNNGVPLR